MVAPTTVPLATPSQQASFPPCHFHHARYSLRCFEATHFSTPAGLSSSFLHIYVRRGSHACPTSGVRKCLTVPRFELALCAGQGQAEGSYEYLVFNSTLLGVAAEHGLHPITDWEDPELDECFEQACALASAACLVSESSA